MEYGCHLSDNETTQLKLYNGARQWRVRRVERRSVLLTNAGAGSLKTQVRVETI